MTPPIFLGNFPCYDFIVQLFTRYFGNKTLINSIKASFSEYALWLQCSLIFHIKKDSDF